jgi:hypothetical protein
MKGATLLERFRRQRSLNARILVLKIRLKNLADFPLRSIDPIYRPEVCRASDFVAAAALNDTERY